MVQGDSCVISLSELCDLALRVSQIGIVNFPALYWLLQKIVKKKGSSESQETIGECRRKIKNMVVMQTLGKGKGYVIRECVDTSAGTNESYD